MKENVNLIKRHKDIKYDYLIFKPKPNNTLNSKILIWGHGSTPPEVAYDNLGEFLKPSLNNIISYCQELNLIGVMPLLPRSHEDNYPNLKYDSQIMAKEVMLENFVDKESFYYRPDIEIKKIINEIKEQTNSEEKILIGGVSAGATMANRFSILYPELVEFSILLISGIFTYPVDRLNGITLEYPFGIGNIGSLIDKSFNLEAFMKINHFLYVGEQDNNPRNDIARFEFIEEEYKEDISGVIGLDSVFRTKKYAEFLESLGCDVNLYIEQDMGHNINGRVLDNTFSYLKRTLVKD